MPRPIITLTTDFGEGSPYVAQMKGVILSLNREANIVDISHSIEPQNIRQGAHVLADLADWYPKDTTHVAVVDPGVGTDRKIIYARVGTQNYIAPDNGLLSLVLSQQEGGQHEANKIIAITNREYWLKEVSATFHGRDIMAPVAAHLSLAVEAEKLGDFLDSPTILTWPTAHATANRIEGSVVSFDSFGNLITDITEMTLANLGLQKEFLIRFGTHEVRGLEKTYAGKPPNSLVALIGSSGLLELAVVNGNAGRSLSVDPGEKVVVTW